DQLTRSADEVGGLEVDLDPVHAVVALGRRLRLGIDVERVVGAGLHARLAADATVAVEIHDAVGPPVQRHRGADGHARRVVAVIAAHDGEVAPRIRERPLLDVLDPGAVDSERHLVLFLAGDRTGVAANALPLVDHETVTHLISALASPGIHSALASRLRPSARI